MKLGRLEIGIAIRFTLLPEFFKYGNVYYDDHQLAKEIGACWLGYRVSWYYGLNKDFKNRKVS